MSRLEAEGVDLRPNVRAFVEDASRALRDPLTICVGYLERLEGDPDEQRTTVDIVMNELDRMVRIVNDLEVLVAADEPDFLHPESLDLATFTYELVQEANALGPRRWLVDRTGVGPMMADRKRLTEAVMDLADNAMQHTTTAETVAIGSSLSDDEARIWVRDTGAGISASDQARVFRLFARGSDAHRRYRGGGLGLSVAKAIAEAHGGWVELESRPGEGSTFTIVLRR